MEIKHGLISADSHVIMGPDTYTDRMSRARWGDLIPQTVEVMDKRENRLVHRWKIYGQTPEVDRGFNCPAALENNPLRNIYPKRWEEVPPRAYDPFERAEAQDSDGVDGKFSLTCPTSHGTATRRSRSTPSGQPMGPRRLASRHRFEVAGPAMRDRLSADNIMWESDYPHIVSTYPESWKWVERSLGDVPEADRKKMLYQNAVRIYNLA